MTVEQVGLSMSGVGIGLETDCRPFASFARQYLLHFQAECTPRLGSRVLFPAASKTEKGLERFANSAKEGTLLGHGVRATERGLSWSEERDLTVRFDETPRGYQVTCVDAYWPRRGRRRFWVSPEPDRHRFQTVLRHAVHYPLFWLLEREQDVYVLHGSAVEIDGRGVLFVGLAGVGKSSLALALTAAGIGRFVSDNYLLYDREKVIPFPEMTRVAADHGALFSHEGLFQGATLPIRGRDYFNLRRETIAEAVSPAHAFLLTLGDKTSAREIPASRFADTALRLGDCVREFHNYYYPGVLPLVLPEEHAVYPRRYENLVALLSRTRCYILEMERGRRLVEAWKEVETSI